MLNIAMSNKLTNNYFRSRNAHFTHTKYGILEATLVRVFCYV